MVANQLWQREKSCIQFEGCPDLVSFGPLVAAGHIAKGSLSGELCSELASPNTVSNAMWISGDVWC